jgi:hypothetical protein
MILGQECIMEKLSGKIKFKILNYRLIIIALLAAVVLLGIVFPASFSDHYKLLHFSAHYGTSFLVSYFLFKLFTVRFGMQKISSFIIVFILAFIFGAIYKYFEISGNPSIHKMPLSEVLEITGFYISMSQNTAGILSAFVLIIYFDKLIPIVRKLKTGTNGKAQPEFTSKIS